MNTGPGKCVGVYQGKHKSKIPSDAHIPHHLPDYRELVVITPLVKLLLQIWKITFQMG